MKKTLLIVSLMAIATWGYSQIPVYPNLFPPGPSVAGVNTPFPTDYFEIGADNSSAGGGLTIDQRSTGAAWVRLKNTNAAGGGDFLLSCLGANNTPGPGNFVIRDAAMNEDRLLIQRASGNVGIGTSVPNDARLQVNRDVPNPSGGGYLWGMKSNIQSTAPTSSAFCYMIGLDAAAKSGYANQNFTIGVVGTGTDGIANTGGFFTATGNNTYGYRNIGVYGTASGNTNPSLNWACWFDGNTYCTSAFWNASDRQFKENIKPLSNTLEKINALNPCTYTFKHEEQYKDFKFPEGQQTGLIAQELEQVFPEFVREVPPQPRVNSKGEKEGEIPGFKAVQYNSLIPVLIEGIKEQQAMLVAQQKEIDELKKQQSPADAITHGSMDGFQLSQNEPNPFTHETIIRFSLPEQVTSAYMVVYDLTGKQVTTFPIGDKGAGSITVSAENLVAGIYIYTIVADGKVLDSKRMVVAGK